MNNDVLAGKWKQLRGKVKNWWGDLTDDELDQIDGKVDILTGMIQEKYGYTREEANEQVQEFLQEYDDDREYSS
jgi:uncharacterized protein YjbJ (UPF0337 family)